ncbi:MAG: hypothetical protein QG639_1091, partial [Patescibacteria group bacterium]|nr:hypothetical protein [Patescibacteria group bacterium]
SGTAISSTPSSSISTKDGELRVETASNLMPLPIQTSSDLEQNEEAEARRLLEQIDSADLNTAQRAADEYGLLDGYIISLERENICKSLSRAIQNKDYERAKIFYSLGARLDEKENYLAAIAITNSDDIISVKKLLNNFSVNINAWDGNGYSLLVRVIRDGLAKQAMMIIRVQRDEKTSSYDERVFLTALSSYALGKVDIPLIQEILVDGVDYNEKVQKFGRRAIFAAYKKSLEEGKTLEDLLATKLSLKIDKSTMTDKEVNLLGIGRMYDLLKSGENLSDAILSSIAANLFHHSISEDDFNTAKTVLPYIKNINEVGSECAHPPLIEVIRSSYFLGLANAIDLVKMILARNEVQVNEFGDGASALLEAVGVSVQSEDGTEYFDTTILELLLARSDIDIDGLRYPLGYNRPLTKACLFGNAKAVELLFDHRASLLVCLLGENRPLLHVAVAANPPYQKSYTDVLAIVKTLLDHGLEKSVKDLTGRTAYDVATERLEFFNCEAQKAGTSNAQELLDILKPE